MNSNNIGNHAIIIGGGFAGLVTARVLAEYFEKVTIIERDLVTDATIFMPRPGVPQAQQVHFITLKGLEILKKFFPTIEKILLEHGSHKIDLINDVYSYNYGHIKPRFKSDKSAYVQTRPLLEGCILLLVKAYKNIHFLYENEVCGLLSNPKQKRITGVRIKNNKNNEEQNMYADFIVDTSGRNTHCPNWLEGLGFQKPAKEEIKVDIDYLTRAFQLPDDFNPDWKLITIYREPPHKKKSGYLLPLETLNGKKNCLVTLIGQHGDFPVNTEEGFLDFARQLESPVLYDAIKNATPITPGMSYKFPTSRRYLYEKLTEREGGGPTGFIAIGDSLCVANPIYGQGMSIGTLCIDIFNQIIAEDPQNYLENIRKNFYKRSAKEIDGPWNITTYQDFQFPETIGKRPFLYPLSNWYRKLLRRSNSPVVWECLVEIANLKRKPSAMLHPAILIRVLPKIFSK